MFHIWHDSLIIPSSLILFAVAPKLAKHYISYLMVAQDYYFQILKEMRQKLIIIFLKDSLQEMAWLQAAAYGNN